MRISGKIGPYNVVELEAKDKVKILVPIMNTEQEGKNEAGICLEVNKSGQLVIKIKGDPAVVGRIQFGEEPKKELKKKGLWK